MGVLTLTSCFRGESFEEANKSFVENVEGCACRFLVWEEDNYSGLSYEAILDECNQVVHAGNPSRYDGSLDSRPKLDFLRCETEVEDWRAMIAEEERRREIRRQLYGASNEAIGVANSQLHSKLADLISDE